MFSSTLKKCLFLFTLLASFAEDLLASPEEILEYEFQDKSLRTKALQPRTQNFERLEFLGDRVLGLATAHLLYKNFPFNEIGWLTNSFQAIVSNSTLFKIYQDFNVDPSELASFNYNAPLSNISQKTASDIVESLIGAIYIEGTFTTAQTCCEQLIKRYYDLSPKKGSTPRRHTLCYPLFQVNVKTAHRQISLIHCKTVSPITSMMTISYTRLFVTQVWEELFSKH